MDYGEFKEKFTQDVKDRLKEEGSNIIISVNEVKKLNERYEAITAVAEGDNIGVNVGIEKFYGAYEDGASYGSLVDKAIANCFTLVDLFRKNQFYGRKR